MVSRSSGDFRDWRDSLKLFEVCRAAERKTRISRAWTTPNTPNTWFLTPRSQHTVPHKYVAKYVAARSPSIALPHYRTTAPPHRVWDEAYSSVCLLCLRVVNVLCLHVLCMHACAGRAALVGMVLNGFELHPAGQFDGNAYSMLEHSDLGRRRHARRSSPCLTKPLAKGETNFGCDLGFDIGGSS